MNLATRFMGLDVKGPVCVAAQVPISNVTLDKHLQLFHNYAKMGASVAITDTIAPSQLGGRTRLPIIADIIPIKSRPPFGNMGFYLLGPHFPNVAHQGYGLALVQALKRTLDIPVIASIGVSREPKHLAQLAKDLEDAEADGIELNLGCPDVVIEDHSMDDFELELACELIKSVCKEARIPISIKVSPDTDYLSLLEAVGPLLGEGIKGVTAINAPISIAPPNIYKKGCGNFYRTEYFAYSGTYGPWDRFLTYKCVAQIYQLVIRTLRKKIDIAAVGGIVEPEHVIEMIMLGASSVQLSSAILWKGYRVIPEMLDYVANFMAEVGFQSIEQMVGISHNYIRNSATEVFKDLSNAVSSGSYVAPYVAQVNENCTSCGLCSTIPCLAIESGDNQPTRIDKSLCSGCGLCVHICPNQALILTAREAP